MKTSDIYWRYTFRLCFFAAVIVYALWRHYRVSHDIRYTVAKTTRQIFTPRNHYAIEYEFSMDNKVYHSSGPEIRKYNIRYPNGRYYVKFPFKSPAACEIQWDRPVPDSVTLIPEEGWKEMP
jgi:hypothetical protein